MPPSPSGPLTCLPIQLPQAAKFVTVPRESTRASEDLILTVLAFNQPATELMWEKKKKKHHAS